APPPGPGHDAARPCRRLRGPRGECVTSAEPRRPVGPPFLLQGIAMNDELLAWREHFPALEDCVHLISHSLGCIPVRTAHDLAEFVEQWDTRSVTAWDEWLPEIDRASARIERLL